MNVLKLKTKETLGMKMWFTSFIIFSFLLIVTMLFVNREMDTLVESILGSFFMVILTGMFGLPGIIVIDLLQRIARRANVTGRVNLVYTYLASAITIIACFSSGFWLVDLTVPVEFYLIAIVTAFFASLVHRTEIMNIGRGSRVVDPYPGHRTNISW